MSIKLAGVRAWPGASETDACGSRTTVARTITASRASGIASISSRHASGIETVVLKGDPAKAGLYTLMLRIAPNVRIQAHSHKDDRVATVVKGTWYFGYGEKFNEASLKPLGPGSFYTEPPNQPHFARTLDEPVVVHITGYGPTDTVYVDTAAAPAAD